MAPLEPDDFAGLVDVDSGLPDLTGAVLVHALDGFVDAGSAVTIARDHLLSTGPGRVIARFDADALFDYRARRPMMRFARDHWESFDAPELAVRLLHDEDEVPYLLLSGPEPDALWERFVGAVGTLVDRLGVRLTVGLNAFPMGLPHTRPTRVILHGSRRELFADFEPWLGDILVPASAGHLVEYRLGEGGRDTMGIATPVPAYLARTPYPAAAAALLRELAARAGLRLPLSALDEAAAAARVEIDAQVEQSDEARAVVRALEEQYDAFVRGSERSLLADGSLPTADELGAELERFLADQARGDNNP